MTEPTVAFQPEDVLSKYDLEIALPDEAVAPGQLYWKIVLVKRLPGAENNGGHNLYLDVLDKDGDRLKDAVVTVHNVNNVVMPIQIDKPPEEFNDIPIWKEDLFTASVDFQSTGYMSEFITGIHTRHADEEIGNTWGHFSFLVVWQLVQQPFQDPQQPEEPEEPENSGCNIILATVIKILESWKERG